MVVRFACCFFSPFFFVPTFFSSRYLFRSIDWMFFPFFFLSRPALCNSLTDCDITLYCMMHAPCHINEPYAHMFNVFIVHTSSITLLDPLLLSISFRHLCAIQKMQCYIFSLHFKIYFFHFEKELILQGYFNYCVCMQTKWKNETTWNKREKQKTILLWKLFTVSLPLKWTAHQQTLELEYFIWRLRNSFIFKNTIK